MPKLTFLGAAGTVTGSKYLVEAAGKRLLVDCGIFQGTPELSDRNYKPLPTDPKTIDYAVLTHAHLDHTGLLPSSCSKTPRTCKKKMPCTPRQRAIATMQTRNLCTPRKTSIPPCAP